jgi:hypothetical protein
LPTSFEILTGRGGWAATPDNYSSLRSLRFAPDGSGRVLYGYGQTIYADIAWRFEVIEPDRLKLEYLESSCFQRFPGFRLDEANRRKVVGIRLIEGEFAFVENVTGQSRRFRWRLDLSASPYPDGMSFPYSVPTTFYGHVERRSE